MLVRELVEGQEIDQVLLVRARARREEGGQLRLTLGDRTGTLGATVSEDIGSTTTHKFGEWRVDSSTLDPCGYVVTLTAWDRTIVNCGTSWWASDDVGFCLREPKPI